MGAFSFLGDVATGITKGVEGLERQELRDIQLSQARRGEEKAKEQAENRQAMLGNWNAGMSSDQIGKLVMKGQHVPVDEFNVAAVMSQYTRLTKLSNGITEYGAARESDDPFVKQINELFALGEYDAAQKKLIQAVNTDRDALKLKAENDDLTKQLKKQSLESAKTKRTNQQFDTEFMTALSFDGLNMAEFEVGFRDAVKGGYVPSASVFSAISKVNQGSANILDKELELKFLTDMHNTGQMDPKDALVNYNELLTAYKDHPDKFAKISAAKSKAEKLSRDLHKNKLSLVQFENKVSKGGTLVNAAFRDNMDTDINILTEKFGGISGMTPEILEAKSAENAIRLENAEQASVTAVANVDNPDMPTIAHGVKAKPSRTISDALKVTLDGADAFHHFSPSTEMNWGKNPETGENSMIITSDDGETVSYLDVNENGTVIFNDFAKSQNPNMPSVAEGKIGTSSTIKLVNRNAMFNGPEWIEDHIGITKNLGREVLDKAISFMPHMQSEVLAGKRQRQTGLKFGFFQDKPLSQLTPLERAFIAKRHTFGIALRKHGVAPGAKRAEGKPTRLENLTADLLNIKSARTSPEFGPISTDDFLKLSDDVTSKNLLAQAYELDLLMKFMTYSKDSEDVAERKEAEAKTKMAEDDIKATIMRQQG